MSKSFYEIHFTGEGFRTLAVYRLFFKRALKAENKRVADYAAEVADWYENGDGRSPEWVEAETQPWFDAESDDPSRMVNIGGQGYRFPTCIHGASLWVDHDIPCGACEMGDDSPIQNAIIYGRESFIRFLARWEWAKKAPGDLDYETRNRLIHWAASLHPGLDKEN